MLFFCVFFFFQAEDGIRDYKVTGVQTCALPISRRGVCAVPQWRPGRAAAGLAGRRHGAEGHRRAISAAARRLGEIGRASCRGRGEISGGAVSLKKKKKTIDSTGKDT